MCWQIVDVVSKKLLFVRQFFYQSPDEQEETCNLLSMIVPDTLEILLLGPKVQILLK